MISIVSKAENAQVTQLLLLTINLQTKYHDTIEIEVNTFSVSSGKHQRIHLNQGGGNVMYVCLCQESLCKL